MLLSLPQTSYAEKKKKKKKNKIVGQFIINLNMLDTKGLRKYIYKKNKVLMSLPLSQLRYTPLPAPLARGAKVTNKPT